MKVSAGLLLYNSISDRLNIFLVHPGGPFWKNKDKGAWSIPKGEYNESEEAALACAIREFKEETGSDIEGNFIELTPVKQRGGKVINAWAIKSSIDPGTIRSNTIFIEWPPKSGTQLEIPEIDKASWFEIDVAKQKINPAQVSFIDQLVSILNTNPTLI